MAQEPEPVSSAPFSVNENFVRAYRFLSWKLHEPFAVADGYFLGDGLHHLAMTIGSRDRVHPELQQFLRNSDAAPGFDEFSPKRKIFGLFLLIPPHCQSRLFLKHNRAMNDAAHKTEAKGQKCLCTCKPAAPHRVASLANQLIIGVGENGVFTIQRMQLNFESAWVADIVSVLPGNPSSSPLFDPEV